jgi:hypothetical protein
MASGHPTGPWTTPRAQAAPGTPAGLTGAFSRVEAPRVADSASSLPATLRTRPESFRPRRVAGGQDSHLLCSSGRADDSCPSSPCSAWPGSLADHGDLSGPARSAGLTTLKRFPRNRNDHVRSVGHQWAPMDEACKGPVWPIPVVASVITFTNKASVFHSFRHGFKDAARAARVSEELHDALTDHTGSSVGRNQMTP